MRGKEHKPSQTSSWEELGGAGSQRQQAEGGFGDGGGVALRPCGGSEHWDSSGSLT